MIYTLVEGHGEVEAIGNLLQRLWQYLELPHDIIAKPRRWPKIHTDEGLQIGCNLIRKSNNCTGLIILKDEDDKCPVEVIPRKVKILRELNLPFPVGYVLLYREYETLLLASLASLKGKKIKDKSGFEREGINTTAELTRDLERIRNAKGMLSSFFPKNKIYKPTIDQLPLTRMIDFGLIKESGLPCYGTLERCLIDITSNRGKTSVYPKIQATRSA